jgi:transcriptional regulator with XRE-family HTH domain
MADCAQEERLRVHALKPLRLEHALSQEDLATAAGVSPGTVNRLERQPGRPVSPRVVRKLAAALGVQVTVLTRCGPGAAAEGSGNLSR